MTTKSELLTAMAKAFVMHESSSHYERMQAALRAAAEIGFVMTQKEPDEEIINAGFWDGQEQLDPDEHLNVHALEKIYSTMLSARTIKPEEE